MFLAIITNIVSEIKIFFRNTKNFILNILNKYYFLSLVFFSLALNTLIEIGARGSVYNCLAHAYHHPLYFLYNVSLILFTFSILSITRKKHFTQFFVCVIWLAIGITNAILMHFRNSPFIAADFTVFKSALAIMNVYLSIPQMISIALISILTIFLIILIFIKNKPQKLNNKSLITFIILTLTASLIPADFITEKKNQTVGTNITQEAEEYGFVCCFLNSLFNSGTEKPDTYSKELIDEIKDVFAKTQKPKNKPNIIILQLESFIDADSIPGVEYSTYPTPNFRNLKKKYSSGNLNVSVHGGGTANTEFEVLTGMNLDYFGIGEYPYESILKRKTVESICYDLKELDYVTHAIHNHTGTFYDRHIVYKNLGFDTFTPVEYMNNIEYNPLGWEKSTVFSEEIFKTIEATKESDFIFAVTSQCHGKYPDNYQNSKIKVSGSAWANSLKNGLEYFADQLYEEDVWLGKFAKEIEKYKEPCIVIIYGDHMPALNFDYDMRLEKNIYQTEYIIMSNMNLHAEDKELSTFNLYSQALLEIGINNGNFTKLHQYALKNGVNCDNYLKHLQYDVTDGEKYIYNGQSPYHPTKMKLGVLNVEITDITEERNSYTIHGNNFTKYSVVYADGKAVDTKFISPTQLKIEKKDIGSFKEIKIAQKAENLTVLGYSQTYTPIKQNNSSDK